ncbi:MAG: lysostaphin resistance A-like protein [Solirubrobacteraceae bacterium]
MPSSSSMPSPLPSPEPAPRRPPPSELSHRGPSSSLPDWPLWTAPAGLVLGFALGAIATSVVAGISGAGSHGGPAVTITEDIVFDLGFVAAALLVIWQRCRPRAAEFGYRRARPTTAVAAVVIAGIAYYGVTAIYGAVFQIHGKDTLPSDLGVNQSTAALVAASVFVCIVAPIAEEFFFRGFVFGALSGMRVTLRGREYGPWIAALLTAILFGAAHYDSSAPAYLIPLGFLGFVLCLVRWRTGSLYPCMALHSANNALALGYNQLGWNVAEILGLVLASWLLITAVTGPLGWRYPSVA